MFSPDINKTANLVTLENLFDDPKNILNMSANSNKILLVGRHDHPSLEKSCNAARVLDSRCEDKFVSPNVINLSKSHLFKD